MQSRCTALPALNESVSCQEEERGLVKVVASVSLVLISMALIFKLFAFSKRIEFQASENEFIAGQFKYQVLLLLLAFLSTTALYILNSDVVGGFLSIGGIDAPTSPVPIFGIKAGESWLSLGLRLSFFT